MRGRHTIAERSGADEPEVSLGANDEGDVVGPPPLPVVPNPWSIRLLEPHGSDLALLHRWMHAPHVADAWGQAWTRQRWAEELQAQLAGEVSRPCLASYEGEPVAYLEIYRAARDRLGAYYEAHPHDLGVHIAIGDAERIGRGLGRRLLRVVADGLLAADPACPRIVAEPDVVNTASIRAFTAAGFQHRNDIRLPHKTAALLIRSRLDRRTGDR